MSANKTRLLFADDTDLLARARPGIIDRPEFDVVMAASTDEALQLAADSPQPGAVVLPADGSIDGLQVCRVLKAVPDGRAVVILALSADDSAKRDACFAAGADDVLFAPIEAAEIARCLERGATGSRAAPRAHVELIVRLASPTGNAVVDATGLQLSREAILVSLPAGMPAPKAGLLLRVVFTLYEGGTLQVWARTSLPDKTRTVLRFVGLTEPERRAIDYFVDFYLKRAGAETAATPNATTNGAGNGHAAEAAEPDELLLSNDDAPPTSSASAENLILSAEIPDAPAPLPARSASPGADQSDKNETLRLISEASLDELADAASLFASGRSASLPAGFDGARVRAMIPKLSATETSALRGTTMYNTILGHLRDCAAARVRLVEMAVVLREGGSRLDKRTAEGAALGAITEAQQIHNALDAGFQELLKGGNTAAVRDLGPVKAGLLAACVDVKAALDRDVLGKEAVAANAKVPRSPTATRYAPAEPPVKGEPRPERTTKESKEKRKPDFNTGTGRGRKIAMGVLLVALFAGGAWSNRGLFGVKPPLPPPFLPEYILFESNGVRVWTQSVDSAGTTVTWIVDSTIQDASPEARAKLFEDLITRSPGMKRVRLIDHRGTELDTRAL